MLKLENSIKVRITLIEEILGTKPGNEDLLGTWVAGKAPTDELRRQEMLTEKTIEDTIEEKMTGFAKRNGNPFIWDYQLKGFLKDSWKECKSISGSKCSKLKAYKKLIDGQIFLSPKDREIYFHNQDGSLVKPKQIGECERPLRAQTMQGERVSIARSETVPADSYIEFTVMAVTKELIECVIECLEYGFYRGLGQWRNSGKGKFYYQLVGEDGKLFGGNMEECLKMLGRA